MRTGKAEHIFLVRRTILPRKSYISSVYSTIELTPMTRVMHENPIETEK
jgi:hypothetical protein